MALLKPDDLYSADVKKMKAHVGWISHPQELLDFLKMRNESSHSYKEEVAKQVYEAAKRFAISCDHLVKILKEKSM